MQQLQQLVGVWKLLYIYNSTVDYSTNTLGRIIFTPSGYMNAMVTDASPLPNGTEWEDASDAQIAKIARPVVAYSGPFKVQNETDGMYTHVAVEIAMDPEWVGTDQVRHASITVTKEKTLLTLIPVEDGVKSDQSLVWEKMRISP